MNLSPMIFSNTDAYSESENALYNFFEKTWTETFQNVNKNPRWIATDYCRFTQKLGLFDNNRPIAFAGFQHFDLNKIAHTKHSYFSQLNFSLPDLFKKHGISKFITIEYLSICKSMRKTQTGVNMGALLVSLSTKYLTENFDQVVSGISRNDRGMNSISSKVGGESLVQNTIVNGLPADVFVFYPGQVKQFPDITVSKQVTRLLWELSQKSYPQRQVA